MYDAEPFPVAVVEKQGSQILSIAQHPPDLGGLEVCGRTLPFGGRNASTAVLPRQMAKATTRLRKPNSTPSQVPTAPWSRQGGYSAVAVTVTVIVIVGTIPDDPRHPRSPTPF